MESRFCEYFVWRRENGIIVELNSGSLLIAEEAFLLFKSLYNTKYGVINENENLVEVHTGGWSDNEELIEELRETSWWFLFHQITAKGGHYYFNTTPHTNKFWRVIPDETLKEFN